MYAGSVFVCGLGAYPTCVFVYNHQAARIRFS